MIEVVHEVASDRFGGPPPSLPQRLPEQGGLQRRETLAPSLNRPVWIEQATRRGAVVSVIVQKREEGLRCVTDHLGIAVEQQDVVPARLTDADVVASGIADVAIEPDQAHLGILALDHVRAPVFGAVVDDDDLVGKAPRSGDDGLQALPKQVFGIPRQHHDGESNHRDLSAPLPRMVRNSS